MKVVIIGAGLAGCAAGYFLNRAGADVVIYEAAREIGAGASGNDVGMVNPRFSAFETPESLFYIAAFKQALGLFQTFDDIDWSPCGALHLVTDEKREKRYRQTVNHWHLESLSLVDQKEASEIAGVKVDFDALYLPASGAVSPRALCKALSHGLDVRFGLHIQDASELDTDIVILANGMGVAEFWDLPLQGVRGQITEVRANQLSNDLQVNLHYGGYFSFSRNGVHTIGATFQRWLDHTAIMDEDDVYNIERLAGFLPHLADGLEVTGHRASIRTTVPDHFPVIGRLEGNVYVSAAHGSHGIVTSIGGGKLLAEMIMGEDLSMSQEIVHTLCPLRFKAGKKPA